MASEDGSLNVGHRPAIAGVSLALDGPPPDQVVAAMLQSLNNYLPSPTAQLPDPSVWVANISEQPVGLGNYRGSESANTFAPIELKGMRLNALVRFALWARDPSQAEAAGSVLDQALLGDRQALSSAGFLRLGVEASPPAELVAGTRGWRKLVDYRVLYEYRYQEVEAATGVIVRIPISSILNQAGAPGTEATIVSDEMVRWGFDAAAEPLVVRGRLAVVAQAAMDFIPGPPPTGEVVMTRTFDGVSGPPTSFHSLRPFLSAITRPDAPERNAQLTFSSLPAFLNAIQPESPGQPLPQVPLGDQGVDGQPDFFKSRLGVFDPPIQLPSAADRLEIAYRNAVTHLAVPFDQMAVVYLRVRRG